MSCCVGISQLVRSSPELNSVRDISSLSFLSSSANAKIEVEVELDEAETIASLDVGNHGSAFLEIKVSQSAEDFINLLPSVAMMSPTDSKKGLHKSRRRKFGTCELSKAVLNHKWDRVLIICRQPFKPSEPFGLSFLYLYTTDCTSPDFISPHCTTPKSTSHTLSPILCKEDEPMKVNRQQFLVSPQHRLPSLKAAAALPSSDVTKPGKVRHLKRKQPSLANGNVRKLEGHCESDNDDGIIMRSKVVKQKIKAQEQEAMKPKSSCEAVSKALNDAHALDMMRNGIGNDELEVSDSSFGKDSDTNVDSHETEYRECRDEKQLAGSRDSYQRRGFLGLNGMSCKREKVAVDFTKSYTDGKNTDKEMLCNAMSHARSTESRIENIRQRYAKLDGRENTGRYSNERKQLETRKKMPSFQFFKKAVQGRELDVAVFGGHIGSPRQNVCGRENKDGIVWRDGALQGKQNETEFEVESKLFVASFDFKSINLDTVTFGDIRKQFEEKRGSALVSRHQKKIFLKVVEKAVDDATD